jgi:hypothetical protein
MLASERVTIGGTKMNVWKDLAGRSSRQAQRNTCQYAQDSDDSFSHHFGNRSLNDPSSSDDSQTGMVFLAHFKYHCLPL